MRKDFTTEWLTTHIEREHYHNEFNSDVIEKPQIDHVDNNNNNGTLLVGLSFSGKTYLILKNLSRIPNQDIWIITKSPIEPYSKSKLKIKEMGEDIKHLDEYENAILVFDDIFVSSNNRYIEKFFIKGRHNNLDNYCLSHSYFDLPKRSIRNNSNKIILSNQTLKDIEKIYRGWRLRYELR